MELLILSTCMYILGCKCCVHIIHTEILSLTLSLVLQLKLTDFIIRFNVISIQLFKNNNVLLIIKMFTMWNFIQINYCSTSFLQYLLSYKMCTFEPLAITSVVRKTILRWGSWQRKRLWALCWKCAVTHYSSLASLAACCSFTSQKCTKRRLLFLQGSSIMLPSWMFLRAESCPVLMNRVVPHLHTHIDTQRRALMCTMELVLSVEI